MNISILMDLNAAAAAVVAVGMIERHKLARVN